MREPRLIETKLIPLANIDATIRLRPVSEAAVESLKASIEQQGLMSEIHLRKPRKKGDPYRLIAGAHRYSAFMLLARREIPAKVWECTDDAARLMEIDDNLAHNDLSPLDQCIFMAERKRVYEKAFPQTRRGAAGGLARHGQLTDTMSVSSIAASAAEAMGKDERTVYRLVAVGSRLTPEEIDLLRQSERKIAYADLEALSKISEPKERKAACRAVSEGTAKTVRDALRQKRGIKDKPVNNRAAQLEKVTDAWRRAAPAARRDFIAVHQDEIRSILADLPDTGDVVSFTTARGNT